MAALVVLINHARGSFYIGGAKLLADDPRWYDYLAVAVLQLTSFGPEAVMLFFVLSGYAMAHSIRFTRDVPRFYRKRVIRIWPPYVAATALAVGLGALMGIDIPFWSTALYLTPSSALTPQFWSLPYEVAFYALCPLALASRGRVQVTLILSMAAIAFSAVVAGPNINSWAGFVPNFLGYAMAFFACGATAYHYRDSIPRVGRAGLFAALAATLAISWVSKYMLGSINVVSAAAVIATAVLLIGNLPRGWSSRRWSNLGSWSYSLYIFHYALLAAGAWALGRIGITANEIRNPFAWLLALPPVLAICFSLYWVTERPCNDLLRRMRRRDRPEGA